MSGVAFTAYTPEVSFSAATAKTAIELTAASNHRVHVKEVRVMFKGTTVSNEPVTVEEIRIGTTGTGTAGTIVKRDADASETPEASFKHSMSVEPTGITVLSEWYIHPQSGVVQPLPITSPIEVSGGDLWGIRVTADDAVVGMVHIECEE